MHGDAAGMHGDALDERRLRRLIEVGRTLVSELDLEVVLQRLLEVARELSGARYAALGILDEEREELERFIALGVDEETRRAIGHLPRGRGVLGLLIEDPKPLRLDDVGEHPRSYGFPPAHPPMTTFLGVPVLIRGQAWGNLYLTEKQGGSFDEADEHAAVILAEWAGIAIENARLYGDLEERREALERAVRGLEATTEVARAVGAETNLRRVLETIAKRARALVDARSLAIVLQDAGEVEVLATAGELERDIVGLRMPTEEATIASHVLRTMKPERVANIEQRIGSSSRKWGVDATAGLFVPMIFRGRPLGLIAAMDPLRGGPEFSDEDERLMLAFAASAATAVATAQSVADEQLRRSIEAAERERGRWARELHDETLQGFGALRVLLSSALRAGSPEGLEGAVRDAVAEISNEIEKLRALIAELRPAALDELGLGAAIEALAHQSGTVHGLEIDTEVDTGYEAGKAPERLEPELESTVYRVVQEALTNVAKHARAEHVLLRVLERDGTVEIAVQDDGVGFDPETAPGGFGLLGMRERLAMTGGTLQITSAPGSGTELRARLPAVHRDAGEVARATRRAAGD